MDIFRDQAVLFLKNALEEQKRCSAKHAREVSILRGEAKNRESGMQDMVEFLQRRIKAVELENDGISSKLHEFLANEASHMAALDASAAARIEAIQAESLAEIAAKTHKAASSEAQLATMKLFCEQKAAIEHDLEQTKRNAALREEEMQRKADQVDRDHRAELVKLRQANLTEIASVNHASRRVAENSLTVESKRLRIDNAKLNSELQFHEKHTARLVAENEALLLRIKALKQKLEISEEKEETYAMRGARQQRRIRELSRQIESTQHEVVKKSKEKKVETDKIQADVSVELTTCRIEAAECRAALKMKCKEMAHLRRLAQAVLSQRTQTEQFFLEALDSVRSERAKAGVSVADGAESQRRQGDTLADVSLAERERILRLLFMKMNGTPNGKFAGPPENDAPDHSFQIQHEARLPPPYAPTFAFVTSVDDGKAL